MYSPADILIVFIARFLRIYSYVIFARVILSWIIRNPFNQYYIFLVRITEPVLGPIRKILPRMGIDLSPIIAFVLIDIIVSIITGSR